MAWPYEKPKKPDAPAIPRARIGQVRRQTFAWLKPSQKPWDYCEFCTARIGISYDPDLGKHCCRECWLTAPRPKAKPKVTESEPGETPDRD